MHVFDLLWISLLYNKLIITNDIFLRMTVDCYTVYLRRPHMQYLVT
jgi:hypothetical protein